MTHPTDEALIEQMARGIAIQIYHDEGLETMNYAGESDYADREWQHYESTARAALAIARKAIEAEMRGEMRKLETANKQLRRNYRQSQNRLRTYKSQLRNTLKNVRNKEPV